MDVEPSGDLVLLDEVKHYTVIYHCKNSKGLSAVPAERKIWVERYNNS
jgi:hypothetical protein